MRKYHHLLACYLPALAITVVAVSSQTFSNFAIGNVVTQTVLFAVLAAIPAYRTGKMSYVDIAWPTGLVAIGLQVPIYAPKFGAPAAAVMVVYLAIGLRMGAPGIAYLSRFHRLNREFPRYRYRRMRWEADGWRSVRIPMQLEIGIQALANASVLGVPAWLVAADPDQRPDAFQFAPRLLPSRLDGLPAHLCFAFDRDLRLGRLP